MRSPKAEVSISSSSSEPSVEKVDMESFLKEIEDLKKELKD